MTESIMIMDKKGKITIPKKIRKEYHFTEGSKFAILKSEDGFYLVPVLKKEELETNLIDKHKLQKIIEENERDELELEN